MRRRVQSSFVRLVIWAGFLALAGCGPCPVEERSAPPPPATPAPEPAAELPPVRLQPAAGSGVLILEEESDAAWQQQPAPDDEGLTARPAPPLPPGHQGFRDHQVILYVADPAAGLDGALRAAVATGGQVITYPISGFEDLGPDERVLVFDARTYPHFLRRLRELGEAEYSELGSSDFVTVRLTVRKKK